MGFPPIEIVDKLENPVGKIEFVGTPPNQLQLGSTLYHLRLIATSWKNPPRTPIKTGMFYQEAD